MEVVMKKHIITLSLILSCNVGLIAMNVPNNSPKASPAPADYTATPTTNATSSRQRQDFEGETKRTKEDNDTLPAQATPFNPSTIPLLSDSPTAIHERLTKVESTQEGFLAFQKYAEVLLSQQPDLIKHRTPAKKEEPKTKTQSEAGETL